MTQQVSHRPIKCQSRLWSQRGTKVNGSHHGHYAKLSLSNAARLSFSDLCILLFMFLSLCRLCVCVFLCSHWSLVDVPLIFICPADHVPDWQPRVLLGMVEARSVKAVVKFEHPRIPAFQPFMKPVSYFLRKQFHAVQCLYQL